MPGCILIKVKGRGKDASIMHCRPHFAEDERFELPVCFHTAVFKTTAISHSANPPVRTFWGLISSTWHLKCQVTF